MAIHQSIQVNIDDAGLFAECSGVLLEVPQTEAVPGDSIEINLWAGEASLLDGYTILYGFHSLGAGFLYTSSTSLITETLSYKEQSKIQALYPIKTIQRVRAQSDLVYIDEDDILNLWPDKGSLVTSDFHRSGYSCLETEGALEIFGTVELQYWRGTYRKKWNWTVPNTSGVQYFFVLKDGKVVNNFQIELPVLDDDVSDSEKDVTFVVRDKVTDAVVEGANVYIDGSFRGSTDEDGVLTVNNVSVGSHTLKITCSGFLDSDEDDLNNDTIEVYN
jgi:hypothetical protein